MTKKRRAIQIDDNEWVTISWTDQHEECCDCKLRHSLDFRVVDGKLQMKGRRLS